VEAASASVKTSMEVLAARIETSTFLQAVEVFTRAGRGAAQAAPKCVSCCLYGEAKDRGIRTGSLDSYEAVQ
jgi:hypothetical protein